MYKTALCMRIATVCFMIFWQLRFLLYPPSFLQYHFYLSLRHRWRWVNRWAEKKARWESQEMEKFNGKNMIRRNRLRRPFLRAMVSEGGYIFFVKKLHTFTYWMPFAMMHCRELHEERTNEINNKTLHGYAIFSQNHSIIAPSFKQSWYFRLLRSPGIDSKELIPPGYVAWRAGTTTLFLLGS